MEQNEVCPLVQDLLPIYKDDAVSEQSKLMLQKHLTECEACRTCFEHMNMMEMEFDITETQRYKNIAQKVRIRRRKVIGAVILLIAAACITTAFFFQMVYVSGECMEPSVASEKSYLLDKVTYRLFNPKKGDIVVYHGEDEYKVGRILGIPGDRVIIEHGNLYVNNRKEAVFGGDENREYFLKQNEYYIAADNPASHQKTGNILPSEEFLGKLAFME